MTTSEATNSLMRSETNNLSVVEVSAKEYRQMFSSSATFFQSAPFNLLNAEKCQRLLFLVLMKATRPKIGIIGGVSENIFLSPFSAPFGGPEPISTDLSQIYLSKFPHILNDYLRRNGILSIKTVLPPLFYAEDYLSGIANGFFCSGFEIATIDLNYHFELTCWDPGDFGRMQRSARKNLRISLKSDLLFQHCRDSSSRRACYEVIRKNREEKNYPLRMTYDQVCRTAELTDHDFFIVTHSPSGKDIAAAIGYRITPAITQIIYWGSLRESNRLKPMNFLSFNVFRHLKETGVKTVDIGPATEHGVPDFGLVQFKRNIGCRASNKITFKKELSS